jgi:hypothetical protein
MVLLVNEEVKEGSKARPRCIIEGIAAVLQWASGDSLIILEEMNP